MLGQFVYLLAYLQGRFQLMNNKGIMHDLESIPSSVEDFFGQLNQFNTCFAFLVHSTSTFHCNPSSLDSPA